MYSGAGTGGAGGATGPPIFGRSVNPIPTGGGQIMPTVVGRLCPPLPLAPPKVFHLPASLLQVFLAPRQALSSHPRQQMV